MSRYHYHCDHCDYGISIGFLHYPGINNEGYVGQVQFVCKNCFTTHAKEIGPEKERFLYQTKRLKRDDGRGAPCEQDEYVISADKKFCCPVCQGTEMITDKDVQEEGKTEFTCPDCQRIMRFLGKSGA